MSFAAPSWRSKKRDGQRKDIEAAVAQEQSRLRIIGYNFLPADQLRGKALVKLGIPSSFGGKINWAQIGPNFSLHIRPTTTPAYRPPPYLEPRKFFKSRLPRPPEDQCRNVVPRQITTSDGGRRDRVREPARRTEETTPELFKTTTNKKDHRNRGAGPTGPTGRRPSKRSLLRVESEDKGPSMTPTETPEPAAVQPRARGEGQDAGQLSDAFEPPSSPEDLHQRRNRPVTLGILESKHRPSKTTRDAVAAKAKEMTRKLVERGNGLVPQDEARVPEENAHLDHAAGKNQKLTSRDAQEVDHGPGKLKKQSRRDASPVLDTLSKDRKQSRRDASPVLDALSSKGRKQSRRDASPVLDVLSKDRKQSRRDASPVLDALSNGRKQSRHDASPVLDVLSKDRKQSRRDASPAAPAYEDSGPAEEQYHDDDGDALDRLTSDHHLVPVSTEIEADVASPPGPPASSWMEDAVDFTVTFTDATQAPQAGSQKKTTQRKSLSLKKPHRKRSTEDRESSPTPEKRRAVVEATVPSPILSQRRVVRLPSTKSSPAFRSLTDICSVSTVLRSASPSPARRPQLGTSQHAGSPVFQPLANRANDRDSADFSVSTASSGSLRPFHSRRGACLDSDDIIIPPSQYYPPPTAEDKTKRSASAAQRDSDSSDVIQPSQYYPPSPAASIKNKRGAPTAQRDSDSSDVIQPSQYKYNPPSLAAAIKNKRGAPAAQRDIDSDDIIIPPSQDYPPPEAEDKAKRSASAVQRDSDSSDVIQPSQYYPPSPAAAIKNKRGAPAAQRDSDSSDVIQPSQYYPPSPAAAIKNKRGASAAEMDSDLSDVILPSQKRGLPSYLSSSSRSRCAGSEGARNEGEGPSQPGLDITQPCSKARAEKLSATSPPNRSPIIASGGRKRREGSGGSGGSRPSQSKKSTPSSGERERLARKLFESAGEGGAAPGAPSEDHDRSVSSRMSVGEPIRLSEDDEDDEVSRMSEDSEDDQRTISAHQLSGGERSRLTEDSEDDERIISTKASAGELSGLSEDDSVCERPEQHVSLREAAALALLARRAGGAAIKAPSASKTPSSRGGSTPRLRAAAAAASDSDSDETLRQREEARCRRRERELSRQSSKRSLVATPPAKRKGARASTHETAAMNRTISSPRHVMDVPPAPVAASTSDSGVEGDRHAVRRSKSVEAVPVVSARGPQCSQPPPPRAYDQTTDDEVPPARRTFISPPPRHRAPSTTTETSTKTSSSTHPTSEPPSSITTSVSTLTHPLSEAASSEQEQEHGESSSALLQAQPKPRVPRMSISDIRVLCGAGHHPIQQPTHRPAQGPAQGSAHGPTQGPAEGPASVVHQAPAHTAPTRHSVSRVALGPQQGRRRPGDRSTPSEERVVATGQERRGSRKRSTPSEERVVATGKERRGSRKRSTPSEERVVATGKERRGSGKRSTPSEERVVATGQERRGSGKRSTPSTGERSTTTRRKTSVSLERIRTHTVDEQDSDSYSDSDLEGLDLVSDDALLSDDDDDDEETVSPTPTPRPVPTTPGRAPARSRHRPEREDTVTRNLFKDSETPRRPLDQLMEPKRIRMSEGTSKSRVSIARPSAGAAPAPAPRSSAPLGGPMATDTHNSSMLSAQSTRSSNDKDRAPSSVSAVSVASSRQSIGVDVVLGTRAFRRPQLPPSRTNDAPDKENIYPPVKAKRKHGPGDGDLSDLPSSQENTSDNITSIYSPP